MKEFQLGEFEEIILLLVDQEMGISDMAGLLDMPVGTVKSHIHRAKKSLLALFEKKTGGPYGREI